MATIEPTTGVTRMIMTRRILGAVLVLGGLTVSAQAATLTTAQLQTLKTNLAASADTITTASGSVCAGFVGVAVNAVPNSADGNACLAAVYSLPASPAFWVWRTSVTKDELVGSTSVDGTTFAWTGTGYITRSQGERDAFAAIFSATGTVNPSLPSVRTAFGDIFSGGVSPAPENRTHLLTIARRQALRGERVFATGTGTTATPGVLVVDGALSGADISSARSQP